MNSDENRIEKNDMHTIHGGNEKNGTTGGTTKHPQKKCAFDNGSCCRRTELCEAGSKG